MFGPSRVGEPRKKRPPAVLGAKSHAKGWLVMAVPVAIACCGCALFEHAAGGAPPGTGAGTPGGPGLTSPTSCPGCWRPARSTTWQIQFTGTLDLSVEADAYEIDLFDTAASAVQTLHSRGRKVVCYIDAGTWEDWRPDAAEISAPLLGKSNGWPGERWLDIRQLETLGPILEARLDLCKAKGFDGVEFDNVDGYANDTGFPLTYHDQLRFNMYLANAAHRRHLSVGLKNDPAQVSDLLPHFDWAVVEECFQFHECASFTPFISAGKAVVNIEYELEPEQFCKQARALHFYAMRKHRNLDAFRATC